MENEKTDVLSGYDVGDTVYVKAKVNSFINSYLVDVEVGCTNTFVDRQYVYSEKRFRSGYDTGVEDAWNTARMICNNVYNGGISSEDLKEIFGTEEPSHIIQDNTMQDAVEKINTWKEEKIIHVGDVVKFRDEDNNYIGVVISFNKFTHGIANILTSGGGLMVETDERLTKTGRTIDIAGLLEQIGGKENGR